MASTIFIRLKIENLKQWCKHSLFSTVSLFGKFCTESLLIRDSWCMFKQQGFWWMQDECNKLASWTKYIH